MRERERLPYVGYGADAPRQSGRITISTGWFGMVAFLAVLASMLTSLLFAYFYLRDGFEVWPPAMPDGPPLPSASIATAVLVGSLAPVLAVRRHIAPGGRLGVVQTSLAAVLALGAAFVAMLFVEYDALGIVPQQSVYASLFLVLTTFVGINAVLALGMTVLLLLRLGPAPLPPRHQTLAAVTTLYWVFVVVAWVLVYLTLYWTPRW